MNTLILSGSVSKNSRSFLLCKAVERQLIEKGDTITFADARKIPMHPVHRGITDEMQQLAEQVKQALLLKAEQKHLGYVYPKCWG